MTIEESRRSQRPYRYGMVLLCIGALINWLGLAENYVEPVRYVGVACIVAGALLICAAMCCWLHAPPTRTSSQTQRAAHPITAQIDDPIHVISIEDQPPTSARQKPPDYEAVADAPPSYDDAIKLNPGQLARPAGQLQQQHHHNNHHNNHHHHHHHHHHQRTGVVSPSPATILPGAVIEGMAAAASTTTTTTTNASSCAAAAAAAASPSEATIVVPTPPPPPYAR